MQVLKHQPVTRFPSIHVMYALYMEHRDSIVDGCKVVELSNNVGSFIVNPSCDLLKMERRLKVFIDYWLSSWKGLYGKEPDEKRFESALVDYDILMYGFLIQIDKVVIKNIVQQLWGYLNIFFSGMLVTEVVFST